MQALKHRLCLLDQPALFGHADDRCGARYFQALGQCEGAAGALVHQQQGSLRIGQGAADAGGFAFVQVWQRGRSRCWLGQAQPAIGLGLQQRRLAGKALPGDENWGQIPIKNYSPAANSALEIKSSPKK